MIEHQDSLIPDLDWLATTLAPDDSWLGPGPMLASLRPWMDRLGSKGHRTLVAATYGAAETARQQWDSWLIKSRGTAMESILDGQPPPEQLGAVKRWLTSPTDEHKRLALDTVDLTKQLHWFHEEYCDVWFDEPGMWAVESSEYCVFSLTRDPYSNDSVESHATICVACAINAFRTSADEPVRNALSIVIAGIRRELQKTE